MKPKKPSSKYEVSCETFIFQRKKWNIRWNMKSECVAFVKIWSQINLHRNRKSTCEAFVKIRSQRNLHQNTKSSVKPLIFRQKMKHSSKYEVKVCSLHQNMKPNKSSSKYKVRCEAFIFREKTKIAKPSLKYKVKVSNLHRNTKSKCVTFVKILSQRNLHKKTKLVVKPSFFREKKTFIEIRSQSV
jgi:hypothetical protein